MEISKNEILNYVSYIGNKKLYVSKLIDLIKLYLNEDTIFVELFGGSGVMSLNLSKYNIDQIFLNEKHPEIYKIHYSFKYGDYENLQIVINEIFQFGDPINIKDDYYKARNELNKKYFKKQTIDSGFYNWAISTFAINSMCRFGPNGFNQGWGFRGENRIHRIKLMDEFKFNQIKTAYKKISLYNDDYLVAFNSIIESNSDKKLIIFVDPPYIEKTSGTYSFSIKQYDEFIETIKNINHKILYTDIYSDNRLKKLKDWNFQILRKSVGFAKPGKTAAKYLAECVYYNFKPYYTLF